MKQKYTNVLGILIVAMLGISVVLYTLDSKKAVTDSSNTENESITQSDDGFSFSDYISFGENEDTQDSNTDSETPTATTIPISYEETESVVKNSAHKKGEVTYRKILNKNEILSYTFLERDAYTVSYFPDFDSILISITASPFQANRLEAEQDLLRTLSLSAQDACKIDVTITTPNFANPDHAGQVYRLSFCK